MRVTDWTTDEDTPRQEPMRANLKPAERKAPTGDQKKERRQLQRKANIDHAGDHQCDSCGYQGSPVLGDATGPNCRQCGSYSIKRVHKFSTITMHCLDCGAGQDHSHFGASECAVCGSKNLMNTGGGKVIDPKAASLDAECSTCGTKQDTKRFGDTCTLCGGKMTKQSKKTAMLECEDCHDTSREDPTIKPRLNHHGRQLCDYCTSGYSIQPHATIYASPEAVPGTPGYAMGHPMANQCISCGAVTPRTVNHEYNCGRCGSAHVTPVPAGTPSQIRGEASQHMATQFEQQIAAPDGRVLINAGDHFRGPGGQTVKIHQVRQRPGFIGQYYLDTDLGTTLVNHDHRLQMVPHDTRQQALPSYADARGNSNTLPGGAGQSGSGGDALHGDVCPVCGSHGAMVSKGNQAVCNQCGHHTTIGGGMSYGDAPHIYGNPKVSSLSTAVARHAAEVYERMNKENPL